MFVYLHSGICIYTRLWLWYNIFRVPCAYPLTINKIARVINMQYMIQYIPWIIGSSQAGRDHWGAVYPNDYQWIPNNLHTVHALQCFTAVNWWRVSDVYMNQWIGPSLVQIMAFGHFSLTRTKPLSEPVLAYCQIDPKGHIKIKFNLKLKKFFR